MRDTAAIIVAGGKGLRFGGSVRKQYLLLQRRPILWWSAAAFEHSPSVLSIILVVPSDDVETVLAQTHAWRLKKISAVVSGGATRADSVREGLKNIPDPARYVAVHDAVRPLVTPAIVERVIQAARITKAALAACLSKDTVKIADSRGRVEASPSRDRVWLAQTPQIFERRLLERANRKGKHLPVTDDAQLVERLGVRVKLVESSPENLKVTLPIDFVLARHILEERS
jgi:2-C-methyl-D-erythritol 4-phosphate cytidylyltransferase